MVSLERRSCLLSEWGSTLKVGPASKSFGQTGKEEGLLCIALEAGCQSQNGVPGTEAQAQKQVSKMSHQGSMLELGVRCKGPEATLHLDMGSGHCQLLSTLGIRCSRGLAVDLAMGQGGLGGPIGRRGRSLDSSCWRPARRLEVRLLTGPWPMGPQEGEDPIDRHAQYK